VVDGKKIILVLTKEKDLPSGKGGDSLPAPSEMMCRRGKEKVIRIGGQVRIVAASLSQKGDENNHTRGREKDDIVMCEGED